MRPMPEAAGPSALDKHQIQASALDLTHFTRNTGEKPSKISYVAFFILPITILEMKLPS